MKKLTLLASLALLAAAPPLAAQARTASIGVSATIAEPVRVEVPTAVKLDFSRGRYLDVTTPDEVRGAAGYLVDVVVTRTALSSAASAPPPASLPPAMGQATRLRGTDGRYRIDLRDTQLRTSEAVRVTYVVATNL